MAIIDEIKNLMKSGDVAGAGVMSPMGGGEADEANEVKTDASEELPANVALEWFSELEKTRVSMRELQVPRGNFAISLPLGFDFSIHEQDFNAGSLDTEYVRHWTFGTEDDDGRIDVSYLKKKLGKSFFNEDGKVNVIAFNNAGVQDKGDWISAVLGTDVAVMMHFIPHNPYRDREFPREDGVCGFSLDSGTLKKKGTIFELTQVALVKGNEAWRIQTLLPSALNAYGKVAGWNKCAILDRLAANDIISRFRPMNKDVADFDNHDGDNINKISFLWAIPAFGGGKGDIKVKEANFGVHIDPSWDKFAIDERPRSERVEKYARYRFMGSDKTRWLFVEYRRLAASQADGEDMSQWVRSTLTPAGGPDLFPPEDVKGTIRITDYDMLPDEDKSFLKKHHADEMCAAHAGIGIESVAHHAFVVCLKRGNEAWKIVSVQPCAANDDASDDENGKANDSDWRIAGRLIGNFHILSDAQIKSLLQSGDAAGAEALCLKALGADPGNAQLKMLFGMCRQLQGDEETFNRIHDELAPEMSKVADSTPFSERGSLWREYYGLWLPLHCNDTPELCAEYDDFCIKRFNTAALLLALKKDASQIGEIIRYAPTVREGAPQKVLDAYNRYKDSKDKALGRTEPSRGFGGGTTAPWKIGLALVALVAIVVAGVIMTGKNRTAAEFSQPFGEAEQMAAKALASAVRNDSPADVSAALAAGADPNFADNIGVTPLCAAVDTIFHSTNVSNISGFAPSVEVVGLLLDAGADPNMKCGQAMTTPFCSIIRSSRLGGRKSPEELEKFVECIRLMLKHGADTNLEQGKKFPSPLSDAVKWGADLAIVKVLVEEGGGIVTDKMIEEAKGNFELREYLQSRLNAEPPGTSSQPGR